MSICAVYVFLQVVKRFGFPKALYKFPAIITVGLSNGLSNTNNPAVTVTSQADFALAHTVNPLLML